MKSIVLLQIVYSLISITTESCPKNYFVATPQSAVPGRKTAAFVTFDGAQSSVNITLRLTQNFSENGGGGRSIEATQNIPSRGILPIEIPKEVIGNFLLQTFLNCTQKSNASSTQEVNLLETSSPLTIVSPVRTIIIRSSKRAYKPEEIVSFWVLALDYDLQILSDVVGQLSVKDPMGSKVVLWDEISLDEGVKAFRFPLSQYATPGKWIIQVEVGDLKYSTSFEVNRNPENGLSDDVAAAEEHYVELKFGKEMHRRYKPGLPFFGKVVVMSTEKTVRVRVKVYDNLTSIYSQDIEISGGSESFIVPAIMADSQILTLQAELVSVEGKEIESHYVLAREPIYKWNSSSDCYLLVEGVHDTLKPGNEAAIRILSTCSCDLPLHYVITTDGIITGWDERDSKQRGSFFTTSTDNQLASNTTCQINFSFIVKNVMAPTSQLLVYYIGPQGEPVSDFISFNVELTSNKIQVKIEEKEWWLPQQDLDVDVTVMGDPALVCVLGGRSSTGSDLRFNPHKSEDSVSKTYEKQTDFLETGLSLNMGAKETILFPLPFLRNKDRKQLADSFIGAKKIDELYLWKCFNYSKEPSSLDLGLTTPSEVGEWSVWAIAITKEGLRYSPSISLTVFRPLQTDFHLPPNLRVGEVAELDIKIVNNLNSCMDVTALLALSEGAQFLSNGLLYVTERLRLGPQGATSLVIKIMVTQPGQKNMTVEVNGYGSSSCEGSDVSTSNSTLVGGVIRTGTIDVSAEGILKTASENAYFCANENLVISTSDNNNYEWLPVVRNKPGLIIETKITTPSKIGPIYLALAESRSSKDRMYRISVGDKDNTLTWISRGKYGKRYPLEIQRQKDRGIHLKSVNTPGILSLDDWQRFWLTWNNNVISFGRGSVVNNQTLLKWRVNKKFVIQELGFASAWGSSVEIRIWNFNDESGFSQVLHLDTPKSAVPGSESGKLLITSGLALPTPSTLTPLEKGLTLTLSSLSSLISNSKQMNDSTLNDLLLRYVQRILSFRKIQNSFSEHKMTESHISTLSTLKVLSKAQNLVNIDPELLENIKKWLQMRQEDDGSFKPLPDDVKYFYSHSTNNSKFCQLDRIAEITAETVIGLYEIGVEDDTDIDAIQKAKIFLENSLPELKSSEALAAVTLALVLLKSVTAPWAVEKLQNVSTAEDGEFGWPRSSYKRDAADWLYESNNNNELEEPSSGNLEEFEASLYALAVFTITGDLKMAESVTRYLFYHSFVLDLHPELLYDTIETLSRYNQLVKNHHQMLSISLATSGMELTDTIQLTSEKTIQELRLPSLPTKVFIYATGAGCGTIQGKIKYSTYESQPNTSLFELSSQVVQEILPGKNSLEELEGKLPVLKIRTCFRWKGDFPSGVVRLEISLFSGYELTCPNQISITPQKYTTLTEYGHNLGKIWFIIANISDDCQICYQYIASSNSIVTSLRPAFAKIYPASREDLSSTVFFHAKSGSILLRGITDDDLITWFGKDVFANRTELENSVTCLENCHSCQAKIVPNKTESTDSNPKIFTGKKGFVKTTNLDQKIINIMTENMENKSENASNSVGIQTKEILNKTIAENSEILSTITSAITTNAINSSFTKEIDKSTAPNPTVEVSSKNWLEKIKEKPQKYIPKHVNTKISDLSVKYLQKVDDEVDETEKDFDPDIKNDRYILLDKKELWGLLKEAVSDQIEEKLKKSEVEITKKFN